MTIRARIKAEINSLNRLNPNITVFIVYGLLYDVFLNMYKPLAVKFLERLGGTEFHIAMFNALPGLSALVLLPGAIMINRRQSRKNITAIFFLVSRFFILMLAFVPFFPVSYQPLMFIAFIATMNLPEAVAQTSMQSFLGTIFDGRVRAQAITLRNKFGNIAMPCVTLITGLIIGIFPKDDAERIVYYQIFYAAAFIVSLLEICTFTSFRERASEAAPPVTLGIIRGIITMPRFYRFLITTVIFQFTWQAGWPLTAIYQIKTLHANELYLAVFAVVSGACSFFSAGFWNRLIQKRGHAHALIFAVFCMSLNMISIGLSPNLRIMLLAAAYSGFCTIGITSTLLNALLVATPEDNRIIAIGIYNTFVNVSLFVSPFFANALQERIGVVNSILIVGLCRGLAGLILLADYLYNRRRPNETIL